MSSINTAPRAPWLRIADMGLFPPFFQWRVDYGGWLFARRFHFWAVTAISAFILVEIVRLGIPIPYFVIFLVTFYASNWLRRRMYYRHRELYFQFRFQFFRALIAMVGVTVLFSVAAMYSTSPSYLWLLYCPVLIILSEYQPYRLRGLTLTFLGMVLVSLLLVMIPLAFGQITPDVEGLVTIVPPILIVWAINIPFHFLIRNIQKRAIEFREELNFAEQIGELSRHEHDLHEFAKTILKISIQRVRAMYGSIWMCNPATGHTRRITSLERDAPIQSDDTFYEPVDALPDQFYVGTSGAPALIEHVIRNGQSRWVTHSPARELDPNALDSVLHPTLSWPDAVHEIAAAIRDPIDPSQVIGVIHVGFKPGKLDRIRHWSPMLDGIWHTARRYVLDWERRLLIHTAQQVAGAWALARRDRILDNLLRSLDCMKKNLGNPKLANALAHHVYHAIHAPIVVWCRVEETDTWVVNGVFPRNSGVLSAMRSQQWTSASLGLSGQERPRLAPPQRIKCPAELLTLVPFGSPIVSVYPMQSKELIGAFGIVVREGCQMSVEEDGILKTFADQLAFAIGNDRAIRKRDEALHESRLLDEIAAQVLRPRPLPEFADAVHDDIEKLLDFEKVHIGVITPDGQLEFPTCGTHSHQSVRLSHDSEPSTSILDQALRDGKPVIWTSSSSDYNMVKNPLSANWPEVRTAVACPLVADSGQRLGLLLVHSVKGRDLTQQDVETLRPVANQVTLALEHMLLREEAERVAKLEERKRIDSGMHDTAHQLLSALTFSLRDMQQKLAAASSGGETLALRANFLDRSQELIEHVRTALDVVTKGEAYLEMTGQDFRQAMDKLLRMMRDISSGKHQIEWDINEVEVRSLSSKETNNLFMIIVSALGNALKHSSATKIKILLHDDGYEGISLLIEDNGVGFDHAEVKRRSPPHTGLPNICRRAGEIGWQCKIDSSPGQGTRLMMHRDPERGSIDASESLNAGLAVSGLGV